MGTAHILDTYTFEFEPEKMTIPESKKAVAEVKTHEGSELFSWPAIDKGQTIEMFWTVMTEEMYLALRAIYVADDIVLWNPQYLGTYQVAVTYLDGKYIDGVLDNNPHRIDVVLKINIRSFTAT